jgi:hypothetical protein
MKADRPASDVEIRRLTEHDLDQIVALYASVFSRIPLGFLARRDSRDFARVFGSANVSVGAFDPAGALVGYQLHNEVPELHFDEPRFRNAAAIVRGPRVLFGKGTVIAIEHQGGGVAPKISAMVANLSAKEGYRYRIGQVHVGNINSLKYVLSGGRTVIGLSTDEFGLNFISCGFFGRSVLSPSTLTRPVEDIEAVATMLESFHAVGLDDRGGRPMLAFAKVLHADGE